MDYTDTVLHIKTEISRILKHGQHKLAYNRLIKTLNNIAKPIHISYNSRIYQVGIYLFNIDYNHITRSCTVTLKPVRYKKAKVKWETGINYYK